MKPRFFGHAETIRALMAGKSIIIDYGHNGHGIYDRTIRFSSDPPSVLRTVGYVEAKNFLDSIRFSGFAVWVRFSNFDLLQDPEGRESLETSSTLQDFYYSQAATNFIRGMTTGVKLPPMDLQKIGVLAVLGVGVFLGLYFLGVF